MNEDYGDVHTSHCCKWHGCKYSGMSLDPEPCSVEDLGMEQELPCEWCYDDWKEYIERQPPDPEWIKYIEQWKAQGGYI